MKNANDNIDLVGSSYKRQASLQDVVMSGQELSSCFCLALRS